MKVKPETLLTVLKREVDNEGGHFTARSLKTGKDYTYKIARRLYSKKWYTWISVANVLKLRRSMFESPKEHSDIIYQLRNLKATVNAKLEQIDDKKGNTTALFETTVQSNVPDSFKLNMQIIKGEEKAKFPCSIMLEVQNRDIVCFLESIEYAEEFDKQIEARMIYESELLRAHTTVIYQ